MSHEQKPTEGSERDEGDGRGFARGFLESLVPQLVRKAVAQGVEALGDEKFRETVVADVVRKAIHKGNEVVDSTEDSVKRFISELSLPKDLGEKILGRVEEYKSELLNMLTGEVHEFLNRIDLGTELQKLLTSLSFEITTEIRFVPNNKAVKPEVKSKSRIRRRKEKTPPEESPTK